MRARNMLRNVVLGASVLAATMFGQIKAKPEAAQPPVPVVQVEDAAPTALPLAPGNKAPASDVTALKLEDPEKLAQQIGALEQEKARLEAQLQAEKDRANKAEEHVGRYRVYGTHLLRVIRRERRHSRDLQRAVQREHRLHQLCHRATSKPVIHRTRKAISFKSNLSIPCKPTVRVPSNHPIHHQQRLKKPRRYSAITPKPYVRSGRESAGKTSMTTELPIVVPKWHSPVRRFPRYVRRPSGSNCPVIKRKPVQGLPAITGRAPAVPLLEMGGKHQPKKRLGHAAIPPAEFASRMTGQPSQGSWRSWVKEIVQAGRQTVHRGRDRDMLVRIRWPGLAFVFVFTFIFGLVRSRSGMIRVYGGQFITVGEKIPEYKIFGIALLVAFIMGGLVWLFGP